LSCRQPQAVGVSLSFELSDVPVYGLPRGNVVGTVSQPGDSGGDELAAQSLPFLGVHQELAGQAFEAFEAAHIRTPANSTARKWTVADRPCLRVALAQRRIMSWSRIWSSAFSVVA
jgi:hypothetical protein